MTIQPNSDSNTINDKHTFEGLVTWLSKRIKHRNKATSKLDTIIANGLDVVQGVDKLYSEQGAFSKLNQYLLYQVAFELWSCQHGIILENLEADRQEGLRENEQLILEHNKVAQSLFQTLESLVGVNDPTILRDTWFAAWRKLIIGIDEFLSIPITPSKRSRKRRSGLGLSFANMSPDLRYAIFATVTFILGISIATLLLIRR